MNEKISTVIYNRLKEIVDTYPVFADVEESKNLKVPYAVYRVKESGERTKENIKQKYETSVFLVCNTFREAETIISEIKSAIYVLHGAEYVISVITSETNFDGDDRKYISEMSFTIKNL